MAERVKARRLSDEEGRRLLRIVRRGEPKTTKSVIRYRRAMVVLAPRARTWLLPWRPRSAEAP